jgi:hypothetical protein
LQQRQRSGRQTVYEQQDTGGDDPSSRRRTPKPAA